MEEEFKNEINDALHSLKYLEILFMKLQISTDILVKNFENFNQIKSNVTYNENKKMFALNSGKYPVFNLNFANSIKQPLKWCIKNCENLSLAIKSADKSTVVQCNCFVIFIKQLNNLLSDLEKSNVETNVLTIDISTEIPNLKNICYELNKSDSVLESVEDIIELIETYNLTQYKLKNIENKILKVPKNTKNGKASNKKSSKK